MMKRYLVYVAGPYTKPDPCVTTNNAVRVGNDLLNLGYPSVIPHLSHFWHTMHPQPYQLWLDLDIVLLERCDVLLRLPGESSGADKEVIHAQNLGIPVVYATSMDAAAQELVAYAEANKLSER